MGISRQRKFFENSGGTMRKRLIKMGQLFLCCLLLIGSLSACGDSERGKVVFTTALAKDELFRIDKVSCSLPEYMLYLTNVQKLFRNEGCHHLGSGKGVTSRVTYE